MKKLLTTAWVAALGVFAEAVGLCPVGSTTMLSASGAKLILLDEPTIGQDYESLLHMAAALRELQERRQTAYTPARRMPVSG